MSVDGGQERIDQVGALISAHPEITHNYLRDAEYNVWFTLIARSSDEIERILAELRANLENNYKSTAQAARVKLGERCEALWNEGKIKEKVYKKYRDLFEE